MYEARLGLPSKTTLRRKARGKGCRWENDKSSHENIYPADKNVLLSKKKIAFLQLFPVSNPVFSFFNLTLRGDFDL